MMISNSTILIPISGTVIDTSAIDGWRQGVEITQVKHFDAGIVKIRSGEKGHRLATLTFVKDKLDDFNSDNFFVDKINLLISDSTIQDLSIRDHFSIQNVNGPGSSLVGSLEPLSKRKKNITALDSDGIRLIDAHDVRAEISIIQGVNDIETERHSLPLDDLKNPILSFHNQTFLESIVPYSEFNAADVNNNNELSAALQAMHPFTDDYVNDRQFSGACGFSFDNNHKGTDSIAFGGMSF